MMNNIMYLFFSSVSDAFIPLPNNILDWSKMKVFADDKINVTEKWKFVFRKTENIVGKGENAGSRQFLLFPQRFPPFAGQT